MRFMLPLAALLLLAACQRDYPADHPARTADATSVWDFIVPPERPATGQTQQAEQAPEDSIEPSIERGPAFSEADTVDEALLAGAWLQVCVSADEQVAPPDQGNLDVLEFGANGQLVWHFITNGEDSPQPGMWEKTAPGVVALALGDQPGQEVRLQLFGEDFFFFWSYSSSIGMWFARLPQQEPPPRIEHNRFTTNLGEMHFESVNDNVFFGTAAGEYPRDIAGMYFNGILIMRWTEPDTGAQGYAAFTVAPDWSLDGVWWLSDYEAAPFGGPYHGQPAAGGDAPAP